MLKNIILKPGRERSLQNFHPWVFSGAISRLEGSPDPAEEVRVVDQKGQFLGRGFYNPASQIRVRLLSFQDLPLDKSFFQKRILEALQLRQSLLTEKTNACRLIHAEGDGLPGLIVDRYHDTLVAQFNSRGMYERREILIELLLKTTGAKALVDRSDSKALKAEGIKDITPQSTANAPAHTDIQENGHRFKVDLLKGQKTGFFLDQRENRRLIAELARGKHVLNCFSYTGGFSVYAAANGAKMTSVDISKPAIVQARENFILNDINPEKHQFEAASVFDYLRQPVEDPYDIIILDPPAFAQRKSDINKAARGYKDINRLAFEQVKENGLVLSCSCSGFISEDLFRKILFGAAKESGRSVQILGRPAQPLDHPVNIYHPEGEYLKTFLMRVGGLL